MQDGIDSLQSARESSAAGAARGKGGYSLSQKRVSPFKSPKRKVCIASEQLEELQRLPMLLPARGGAAFEAAIRFASAPTTRCCAAVGGSAALRMRHTPCGCRSAHLVEVRSNHRLPEHSSMRRAPAMPLFRKQSAAEVTSLAPHDSKARLLSGRDSQGFMAKPCTPHPHCAARAALQAANPQWRGQGAEPLAFSWGIKRGPFSHVREWPPLTHPCTVQGNKNQRCRAVNPQTIGSSISLVAYAFSAQSARAPARYS